MARGQLSGRLRNIENKLVPNNRLEIIVAYSNEDGTYKVDDKTLTETQLDKHLEKCAEIHGSENIFTIIF